MARALAKVQKKISKKRGGKPNSLHQNSRDAQRLRTASAREEKIARLMDAATRSHQIYVDRVVWFRSTLEGSTGAVTDRELHLLCESFIGREDEDLEEARSQRRPGRPPSKAEERITQRKESEEGEYKSGFWVPELRTQDSQSKIERWSGDWAGLNSLEFVRVVRHGEIKPSTFPPKGLS